LAGRWALVLVCYLDDSGKDPQNAVTTVAGYIATDTGWEAFEKEVEKWFAEYRVNILHAKQLHDTDAEFRGWSKLRKQAFVARVCQTMRPHVMMGMTMGAVKGNYKISAAKSDRKRTVTPYTFCFNVIVDWIMRDIRIGRAAHEQGVALILEAGHENNPEAEEQFYDIRKLHGVEDILRSISFVPKDACRAIQVADLLAFYSRRDHEALVKANDAGKESDEVEMMIKIITEVLPHRGFVANGFDYSR
jgi:hypothetical protein